jgi:hypothetical protein
VVIWLIIAAQLTAPHPARHWLSHDDVPIGLLGENTLETVGFRITIEPDGGVRDCVIEVSSGIKKLDAYTCKLATRRTKLRPGRLRDGSIVHGVYRSAMTWWVGDGYPPEPPMLADVYLTVSRLPPEVKSPILVRLMSAVDEQGQVYDCVAEDEKNPAELVKVACDQAKKSYVAKPVKTAEGVAVKSTQSVMVSIEAR